MSSQQVFQEVFNSALALHSVGKYAEAIALYNKMLNQDLESEQLRFYLADALMRVECNGLAIHLLKVLLEKNAKHSNAWCNLGVAYRHEGYNTQAEASWKQALLLSGDSNEVCGNMAGLFADSGQPSLALSWCARALACEPGSVQAHWQKAMALLTQHNWVEGWKHFEYRRQNAGWDGRVEIEAPDWKKQKLTEGQRLYLHGEQGVGDEIMFLGWLPKVLHYAEASQVTVEVNQKVAGLVGATWPGIKVIVNEAQHDGSYDYKLPLGSLPGLFGKPENAILGVPYLKPDTLLSGYYRAKLAKLGPRPWIALTWLGGSKRTNVIGRSLPIAAYATLMQQYTCVSAQYEDIVPAIAVERLQAGMHKIDDLCIGGDLHNQAALFQSCDAVITVAQTAMHVAGGVGARCYVLLPEHADWRYGLGGNRIPFYESVRLVRKDGQSWVEQIARVQQDIQLQWREEPSVNASQKDTA